MSGSHELPAVFCGYDASDPKLEALYSKGKTLQWDAAAAIDWSLPVDPGAPVHAEVYPFLSLPIFAELSDAQREMVTADVTIATISQFLHGEQGALMVAAKLVDVAPDFDAKLYSATQTMDEARHLEVFSKYLHRVGGIRPVTKSMQRFLEMVIGVDSWLKMLVGMQIVVEGAALSSFHAHRRRCRDPLLADVLDGVIRDEARHVGFGHLYLSRALKEMDEDAREDLADFALDVILRFSASRSEVLLKSRAAFESVGVDFDDVLKSAAKAQQSGTAPLAQDAVRGGIAEIIIPMLRRVGALTPRVEEKMKVAKLNTAEPGTLLDELTQSLEA